MFGYAQTFFRCPLQGSGFAGREIGNDLRSLKLFRPGILALGRCYAAGPCRTSSRCAKGPGRRWNLKTKVRHGILKVVGWGRTLQRHRAHKHSRTPGDSWAFSRRATAQQNCQRSQHAEQNRQTFAHHERPELGRGFRHIPFRRHGVALQAARGSSIRNVVPLPTSDVKSIEPLRSCTMRNVLARPIPLPPGLVVKKS